ncbi:Zinc finger protein 257-like 2 [Homarus americanus]|uniref:Zinc finger protein 257-like 2 n=1 Tax=Homarus americanus TaxID=6706 RepID=A0A8J5KJQ4_HOMAM|nr:Zinc finger protein 257-like 2 [Homarus americanus]
MAREGTQQDTLDSQHSIIQVTDKEDFKCEEFDENESKYIPTQHMTVISEENKFKCEEPSKICITEGHEAAGSVGNLRKHMVFHTGEKNFKCEECGKCFYKKTHLKQHMFAHTGKRNFSCAECGKSFFRKEYLKKHIATHTS